MPHRQTVLTEAEAQEEEDRRTASLAGVAVTLLLLVLGVFLVRVLHTETRVEDCLMSGRSNCAVQIAAPP